MHSFRLTLQLLFVFVSLNGMTQSIPFQGDIDRFRLDDSLHPKPDGMIVFTGSSSITIWKDLAMDFPGYSILNRGFGGSSLPDVIRFAPEVILKYHPRQVLIYCGENDLAADSTIGGKEVFNRMKALTRIIRQKKSNLPILIVSIKPSPSRYHLLHKVIDANHRIEKYCDHHKFMTYINVFDAMLGSDQKPRPELFLQDMLHMNRKGYDIWTKIIGQYLLK